jgi:hypothetical protein
VFISDRPVGQTAKEALIKSAKGNYQVPLLVEDCREKRDGVLRLKDFLDRLGGPIDVWLPLSSDFEAMLNTLGHNKLVEGMVGKADDSFEEAVKQGLQFLFGSRVIRYGQERLFEKLPDGVGFAQSDALILYDAKAYGKGYKFSQDSIRTFSDYVRKFNDRYSGYVGKVYAFVVISGDFADSEKALKSRDSELYASCQTRLVCLNAVQLAKLVNLIRDKISFRNAIDWKRILAATPLEEKELEAELKRIAKDKIVR